MFYSVLNIKNNVTGGFGIYFELNDTRNASRILDNTYSEKELQLKALKELYYIIKQDLLDDLKITIVMESEYAINALNDNLTNKTEIDKKIKNSWINYSVILII